MNDLLPVSIKIQDANITPVNNLGAFRATVNEMSKNEVISYNSIIYVCDWFYFLVKTKVELLIINRDFPIIGTQLPL